METASRRLLEGPHCLRTLAASVFLLPVFILQYRLGCGR